MVAAAAAARHLSALTGVKDSRDLWMQTDQAKLYENTVVYQQEMDGLIYFDGCDTATVTFPQEEQ